MSEFAFIYVFLIFFALCVAAIAIIHVAENKSAFEDQNDMDFFTKLYNEKEEMLRLNMPNISIKTYLALSVASHDHTKQIVCFFVCFIQYIPSGFYHTHHYREQKAEV